MKKNSHSNVNVEFGFYRKIIQAISRLGSQGSIWRAAAVISFTLTFLLGGAASGAPLVPRAANFAYQIVPTTMVAGQKYTAQVSMNYAGGITWNATDYFLGAVNPVGNDVWGVTVVPNTGSGTFVFEVTAPSVPGTYNFQWQMMYGNEFFGQLSDNQQINVVAATATSVTMTSPLPVNSKNGTIFQAAGCCVSVNVRGRTSAAPGTTISKVEVLDGNTVLPIVAQNPTPDGIDAYVIFQQSGKHFLSFRVTDSSGGVAVSAVANIFITLNSANSIPTVKLKYPASSLTYSVPAGAKAIVPIAGTGFSYNSTIAYLQLFDGAVPIATLPGPSIDTTVLLGIGTHSLRLRSADIAGANSDFTDPVVVTVTAQNSAPYANIISPASGGIYYAEPGASADVTLLGVAADPDGGTIAKLELLDGGSVLASVPGNQLAQHVALPRGSHALQMRAADNFGATGLSSVTSITVLPASQGVTFNWLSQTSTGGSVDPGLKFTAGLHVEVHANDSITPSQGYVRLIELREGASVLASQVYSPRYDSNNDLTNDGRNVTLTSDFAIGVHQIYLRVYTPTSYVDTPLYTVTVTVKNQPPTVTLLSPAQGATFTIPNAQYAIIPVSATAADSDGTVVMLELLEGDTVLAQAPGASINDRLVLTVGMHVVRLRATDNSGAVTYGSNVSLTVRQGTLLGAITEIRSGKDGRPQVVGWVCQDTMSQGLNFQVFANLPDPAMVIGSGVANVATELDNADVQSKCHTLGAAHHFVFDLSGAFSGGSLFVTAQPVDGSAAQLLPCTAAACVIPGDLQIALLSPVDGFSYPSAPARVTIRAKILNGAEPYDGVDVNIDGGWISAAKDSDGTYIVTTSFGSPITHTIYARVRKGNVTLNSTHAQIYTGNVPAAKMTLSATPVKSRVTADERTTVNFTGRSTESGRTVSKLELFQLGNGNNADIQLEWSSGNSSTLDLNTAWTFGAGIYRFKLRSTNDLGVQTESAPVVVS
uniref:hypothetical protein n=1 Tax=Duganella sp. S19_KUP01_CR8 TaxID=3025502 RepID=UPI002FCDC06A